MTRVLYADSEDKWEIYGPELKRALAEAGVQAEVAMDWPAETVDYIVYAPSSWLQDFTPYTKAKAVLNLWAGVEGVTRNETLKIPLARMVDKGMTEGMVEWVTGHVLRHHLGMDTHILGQDGEWRAEVVPPLARQRQVTVLGLGALGQACASTLASLGFNVTGWSRSPKDVDGVTCLHGTDGFDRALSNAEIVVLLVPLTPATKNLLDGNALGLLPDGAVIINPGRGPLIDDDALLNALDSGKVGHATLDVFRKEPLPVEHSFWSHPNVTVTPHIASATRPDTASDVIAENIRRGEAGEPFLHLVDREAGY